MQRMEKVDLLSNVTASAMIVMFFLTDYVHNPWTFKFWQLDSFPRTGLCS